MRILKENTIAIVVDIQERLFPYIHENQKLLKNSITLAKGLQTLKIPIIVTEQYKKGLGQTMPELEEIVKNEKHFEKIYFSCYDDESVAKYIDDSNCKTVILFGMEAHICLLQTAIDLKTKGYTPVVIEDCISSRTVQNKQIAINRMIAEGVVVSSYESILFELIRKAKGDEFKIISKLIK